LELAEAKLANAETQVEDLKIQLDDALGAEDMLEQLTDRNLQMGEVSFSVTTRLRNTDHNNHSGSRRCAWPSRTSRL